MTRIEWIGYTAALIISLFTYDAHGQRYCYTLGADMAQCTDGTTAYSLGNGNVVINDPPQQQTPTALPSLETLEQAWPSVPTTTTRAYLAPLLTTQELIEAAYQAKRDCFGERPGPLNTCAKRGAIEAELTARGMCFGSSRSTMADSKWQKCER